MPSQEQSDDRILAILVEIRNWLRASNYKSVRILLEEALPDPKSRAAYQMFDGTKSVEQVRTACKLSPNVVVALTARCSALGLMDLNAEKKRVRLFDLDGFGLIAKSKGGAGD
jgi:hypothetical protein